MDQFITFISAQLLYLIYIFNFNLDNSSEVNLNELFILISLKLEHFH